MIYLTKELLEKGETEYSIKKQVATGSLFLVERGVYSDEPTPYINEAYISKKYPYAIFTGLSAFYLYDLTDHIPDAFYLATEQHSFPIRRKDIIQSYQDNSIFSLGKTSLQLDGENISIYDLERLLIELIRLKEKYPPEIYYDVIASYRKIKDKLDFFKINEYAKFFRNGRALLQKIKEVI